MWHCLFIRSSGLALSSERRRDRSIVMYIVCILYVALIPHCTTGNCKPGCDAGYFSSVNCFVCDCLLCTRRGKSV